MNLRFVAYAVLGLFFCALALSTMFAYSRGYSGSTGLNMAKVQKMRTDAMRRLAGKHM